MSKSGSRINVIKLRRGFSAASAITLALGSAPEISKVMV